MLRNAFMSLLNGQPVDLISVLVNIAACLTIIFLILPLHEYAHALIANKLGDPTAEYAGRLTLNPLASFDPLGCLCMILFGFGWAKPVPINTRYFKHPRRDAALVAIAGPLSNLLAALVGNLIRYAVYVFIPVYTVAASRVKYYIMMFLWAYVFFNVSLAVFNLLPVPPLDGSRVVSAFLPPRAAYLYNRYQREISMLLFVLIWIGVLSIPLSFVSNLLYNGIDFLCALPFRLFGVL